MYHLLWQLLFLMQQQLLLCCQLTLPVCAMLCSRPWVRVCLEQEWVMPPAALVQQQEGREDPSQHLWHWCDGPHMS